MAFKLKIRCGSDCFEKEYLSSVRLSEAIAESGFDFDAPCGNRGVCGNCRVIVNGECSEPDETEKAFLDEDASNGIRLACMTYINGDCVVDIPKQINISAETNRKSKVKIAPVTGEKHCIAAAVDLGTTTIVIRYFSLPDGKLLFSDVQPNPQRIRGADVLTRISYAENGGADELRSLAESALERSRRRFGHKVDFYMIAGNTAMLLMLSGKAVSGIARAPFEPETLFGYWEGNRYYMKCVSAYIGSDAVASLLSSGMYKNSLPGALCDIGTNNECILWNGRKLYACSSPAGPAFEGADISCGMTATNGAIFKVENDNGKPRFSTVGNAAEPIGFCGSGLIDAVAFLLANGYIGSDGSVKKPLPSFGSIRLEANDIAELQLAKSAVCAGLELLLANAEITSDSLNTLYLAGSFGQKIDPRNAELIGMIPKNCGIKVSLDCSAIDGVSMALLNEGFFNEANGLAGSIETIEAGGNSLFSDLFIKNMYFREFPEN